MRTRSFIMAAIVVAAMFTLAACAAMQTPGNPTTQAINTIGQTAGTAGTVVETVNPTPTGLLIGGGLSIISAIAVLILQIVGHKTNAASITNAVAAGAAAAGTTLATTPGTPGAIAATKAALQAANGSLSATPTAVVA
jgi:hypothetical protein